MRSPKVTAAGKAPSVTPPGTPTVLKDMSRPWAVPFTLVATRRTRIHMKLGVAGGVLAALMIIIGTFTAIIRAKGASPLPGVNPLSFLTIPLGDMLVFGILVGAAFYFRRKLDAHKRLMLLASIALLPAGVARWPIGFISPSMPRACSN